MCIIIVKPAGVKLPSINVFKTALNVNGDGCGFMTDDGLTFHALKSDFKTFWHNLKRVATDDRTVAVHFRWATHGSVCLANTHPFNYHNQLLMMHNGVLNIESVNNKTDSEIYLNKVAKNVLKNGLASRATAKTFHKPGNRFVVCDTKAHMMVEYGEFTDVGGIRFSNVRPFVYGRLFEKNGRLDYEKDDFCLPLQSLISNCHN